MCGIAGIWNYQREEKVTSLQLEKMLNVIHHRGPDEQGIYLNNNLGIGNVRLSIVDLFTGQQPMCDYSGNYWIVFNGEIFNYKELRNEIEKKGYYFKSTSDTEVLLAAYTIWGKYFLSRLNGQFAFAIYNKKKHELFMARDRVGICPLFYTFSNVCFVFASEIKAILQHEAIKPEISIEVLMQIFSFWAPLAPNTIFKNINQLSPGHYLEFKNGVITIEPYWTLSFPERGKVQTISFSKAQDELQSILNDAVKIRMRADVPVAAYLSGGLDSSALVSHIKQQDAAPLTTFSIAFNNKDFDESNYQKLVSNFLGTTHKQVTFDDSQLASLMAKIIWHAESPLLRSAPGPMFLLSEFVREQGIKVVVTGEGSDEMLGGYDIFKEMIVRRFWARQPQSKLRPLLLKRLYPYIPQIQDASALQLRFFYAYNLENVYLPYYSHIMRWNNGKHLMKYLNENYQQEVQRFDPFELWEQNQPAGFSKWGNLEKAQYIETSLFMSGYLLSSQGDRMTMANSVEGRYPFLDHRFIEFAAQLPSDYKLKGLDEKYILKKTMKGKIPDDIIRRPKQAYRAPVGLALINSNDEIVNYALDSKIIEETGLFKEQMCKQLFEKVKKTGTATELENMTIMAIVSTQLLHLFFIQSKLPFKLIKNAQKVHVIDESFIPDFAGSEMI